MADEEVPVSHDAQIARPSEFRAKAERRTVEGSNEDDAAAVHPQERRVQAVHLDGSPQRGPRTTVSRTLARSAHPATRITAEAPCRPTEGSRRPLLAATARQRG